MYYNVSKGTLIKLYVFIAVLVMGGYLSVYVVTQKSVENKYKGQQSQNGKIPVSSGDLQKDFVSLNVGNSNPQNGNINLNGEISATGTIYGGSLTAGSLEIDDLQGVLKAEEGKVIGSATTSDLPEGGNLYYKDARFDSRLAAKTTDNLAEGSNKYHSDARTRAALQGTSPINYNTSTGTISLADAGVTAGTYGSNTQIAQVTIDSKGRVTSATNVGITPVGTPLDEGRIWVGNASNQAAVSDDVYITSDGKVGIGRTAPIDMLHVYDGNISVETNANTDLGLKFRHSDDGQTYASVYRETSTGKLFIKNNQGNPIILDNGSVAIGTATPASAGTRLTVQGTSAFQHSGTSDRLVIAPEALPGNGAKIYTTNAASNAYAPLEFNASKFVFTVGNVGIGTTNPATILHVQGNSGSTTQAKFTNYDFVQGSTGSQLALGNGAATGNSYSFIQAATNGGGSVGDLILNQYGGNVGIGTTNPETPLDVNGNIMSYMRGTSASRRGLIIQDPNGSAYIYSSGALGNGLGFYTNSDQADARMMIDGAGNIGIGTTTFEPGAKLQVAGGHLLIDNNMSYSGRHTNGALVGLLRLDNANKTQLGDTTTAEAITLTGGNVGINEASPGAKLHVVSNAGVYQGARFSHYDAGAGNLGSDAEQAIDFRTDGASPGATTYAQLAFAGSHVQNAYSINAFKVTAGAGSTANLILQSGGGKVGIGTTNPSASIHLKAGTAAAATAPIKLTAGTLMTTPEIGAVEYDGTKAYITLGAAPLFLHHLRHS